MDDLELNGTGPQNGEPAKEPEQTIQQPPAQPQTPPQPAQPQEPGFYAWTGTQLPRQEPVTLKKESPFANSPYVRMAPEAQQEVRQAPPQPRQTYSRPPQQYFQQTPPRQPYAQMPQQPYPHAPQPPKPPRRKNVLGLIALLVSGCALLLLLFMYGNFTAWKNNTGKRLDAYGYRVEQLEKQLAAAQSQSPTIPNRNPSATHDTPVWVPTAGDAMTPAQVYAQCVPSVVAIHCQSTGYNAFGQAVEASSSGSGFILSEDGYIVTNYHVVENSTAIEISLHNGITHAAKYIGGNAANDIALIKVETNNLPPVTIGSSSDLVVGDQVVAIGNPLGELASTLTVGYVSAKDRIVTSEGTQINMLQTDAAINPGNSGGPLFNMYGEVVGITSAKYSGTTDSGATIEGIGFAIPTDDVMMMLEDLRNFGHITGGYLGVSVSEVSQEAYELYGLPQGVLVRDVMPNSCAEKAGMHSQDIIIELAGNAVKNLSDLSRALNKCKAGQEVSVIVYRSGTQVTLKVILDERPKEEATPQATQPSTNDQYIPWPGEDWFGSFFP